MPHVAGGERVPRRGGCAEGGGRIDREASGVVDLVVQVGSGAEAGVVGVAQDLAGHNRLAGANDPGIEVHVGRAPGRWRADFDGAPHAGNDIFVGPDDRGARGGDHRLPVIGVNVDAPVRAAKEGEIIFGAVVEVDIRPPAPDLGPAGKGVVRVGHARIVAGRAGRVVVAGGLADGEQELVTAGLQGDEGEAEAEEQQAAPRATEGLQQAAHGATSRARASWWGSGRASPRACRGAGVGTWASRAVAGRWGAMCAARRLSAHAWEQT